VNRRTRTLVVDEREFAAELTAETLTAEYGIDAVHETSAADALETLADGSVDCIVLGSGMGGTDGVEFLRTVRERVGGLPALVLTGRTEETVAGAVADSGLAGALAGVDVVADDEYGRLAARIETVVSRQRIREKYEGLVENSPDAILHVSTDGTVLSANPAAADRLGLDSGDLAGADVVDVFPAGVGARRLAVGRRVVETGESDRAEDGYEGRSFHDTFVPVGSRRGGDSFQLVSREVTERGEGDRELERPTERLDRFAEVVGHDLRNPLNVAQTSVELLREDCATEDLERIDRSLVRMGDIIDDVLTLAREGGTVGELTTVDLSTMVGDARESVETGDVALSVDGERRIEADPGRLRDLLENLIANAVEHGGSVSTVTVGTTDAGFFVADDGEGVPADHEGDVFEAGFTTDRTGTGLGLQIVRDVANAHGWRVDLGESRTGGARFDVVVEDS
jgi:PAS domain S-box-containing protein